MAGGAAAGPEPFSVEDETFMARAVELAAAARRIASPNPWVGCVIVADGDVVGEGATAPPGGPHAEVSALAEAGAQRRGATCYVTLEPCSHHGRTPPCADALVDAGVGRVVAALVDPDPRVGGGGLERLRARGVGAEVGLLAGAVEEQLAPYLKHRRTGRPFVVLKLATTLDGRTAAPDGSSRWITGEAARRDAHELRADSDAVLVGAGTVRADDPLLTVRTGDPGVDGEEPPSRQPLRQPLRVVLGRAPATARVHPAVELSGDLGEVLDELGRRDVLQLLVEGGAHVAHDLHAAGLVDRYVFYLAPALFGGDDARPAFAGPGAPSMEELWRGQLRAVTVLGADLRVDLDPAGRARGPRRPPVG